jgi:hypothetical protein
MNLMMTANSGTSAQHLTDIGFGAAGFEQVVVPNIFWCKASGGANLVMSIPLPLYIPAGTRVSARTQASVASHALGTLLSVGTQGFVPSSPLTRVTDYGTATGSSGGTSVDPGATANTKGAWTQMVASTTHPIKYLFMCQGSPTARTTGCWWLFDIGIGGAGSEQVLVPNLNTAQGGLGTTANVQVPCSHGPFPVSIPAGTRLSVRSSCSVNTAGDRLLPVALYGID